MNKPARFGTITKLKGDRHGTVMLEGFHAHEGVDVSPRITITSARLFAGVQDIHRNCNETLSDERLPMHKIQYVGKARLAVYLDYLFHGQRINNQLQLHPKEEVDANRAYERQMMLVQAQHQEVAERNRLKADERADELARARQVAMFQHEQAIKRMRQNAVAFNIRAELPEVGIGRKAEVFCVVKNFKGQTQNKVCMTEWQIGRKVTFARLTIPVRHLVADSLAPEKRSPVFIAVYFREGPEAQKQFLGEASLVLADFFNTAKMVTTSFDIVDERKSLAFPRAYTNSGKLYFDRVLVIGDDGDDEKADMLQIESKFRQHGGSSELSAAQLRARSQLSQASFASSVGLRPLAKPRPPPARVDEEKPLAVMVAAHHEDEEKEQDYTNLPGTTTQVQSERAMYRASTVTTV